MVAFISKPHDAELEDLFRAMFRVLAEHGLADEVDSAEYGRVFYQWRDAGRPLVCMLGFILSRTNEDAASQWPEDFPGQESYQEDAQP